MKKFLLGLTVMALILMIGGIAYAGTTATQTFNVAIAEINELSVSGNPGDLTVNSATAGSNPNWPTNNSTTYSITTNGTSKKITGQITAGGALPTYINLQCYLLPPSTGSSDGYVTLLASSAQLLVSTISTVADNTGNTISYRLLTDVSSGAGTMTQTSKTITFTLCAQ